MKTGDKVNREQLVSLGYKFSCFFSNCEVWKNDTQMVFWNLKTQLVEMVLVNF